MPLLYAFHFVFELFLLLGFNQTQVQIAGNVHVKGKRQFRVNIQQF